MPLEPTISPILSVSKDAGWRSNRFATRNELKVLCGRKTILASFDKLRMRKIEAATHCSSHRFPMLGLSKHAEQPDSFKLTRNFIACILCRLVPCQGHGKILGVDQRESADQQRF
jgi:hypothetical protein